MASLSPLWWTTPLQALAALSAGWNCGASSLQSLLVLPMLSSPSPGSLTPQTASLLRWNLTRSDSLFPRVNAFGELLNLTCLIIAVVKRSTNASAAAKWQYLAAAFACNISTTIWSLTIQVPINNRMKAAAKKVEDGSVSGEEELRELMESWKPRALVRASMMFTACALGMYTVFLDGKYL